MIHAPDVGQGFHRGPGEEFSVNAEGGIYIRNQRNRHNRCIKPLQQAV
jgi:hypothetical protein